MSGITYRQAVMRTANIDHNDFRGNMSLGAMGLAGEAGEVVDLIKKKLFHNKDVDGESLVKELGDVLWYIEYISIIIGTTREEIEFANIKKLEKRFPNGFNFEDANNRKDVSNG